MTDTEFMAWLHGYAYVKQSAGYGSGPVPEDFLPIVPFYRNQDGTIDREHTLENFGDVAGAQRKSLLEKSS